MKGKGLRGAGPVGLRRVEMGFLRAIAAPVVALMLAVGPAGAITYNVDLTLNVQAKTEQYCGKCSFPSSTILGSSIHVSGSIETDGTLGVISSNNLISWSITMTDWNGVSASISNLVGTFTGALLATESSLSHGQQMQDSYFLGVFSIPNSRTTYSQFFSPGRYANSFMQTIVADLSGAIQSRTATSATNSAVRPIFATATPPVTPVPVPLPAALLAAAMAGLGILGYARRRTA